MDAREKAVRDAEKAYRRGIEATKEARRTAFRKAQKEGLSLSQIASVTGLHRSRVDQILKGK